MSEQRDVNPTMRVYSSSESFPDPQALPAAHGSPAAQGVPAAQGLPAAEPTVAGAFGEPPVAFAPAGTPVVGTAPLGPRRRMTPVVAGIVGVVVGAVLGFGGASVLHSSSGNGGNSGTPTGQFPGGGRGYGGPGGGFGGPGANGTNGGTGTAGN
jgi:hypothetical protein